MTGPQDSEAKNRNPNLEEPSQATASQDGAEPTGPKPGASGEADALASEAGAERPPLTEPDLIAELETERLRLEGEVSEMRDRVLRAHAEMDNLRKRTEREKADASRYGITKFAMEMLSVADNLQRAMQAVGDADSLSDDVKGMYEGVALTAQELTKSLEKNGVVRIAAKGALFDPHLHQAIMEQPEPSVPSGTILQVFQEGYTIGDRVLRPSMVQVARGGPKPERPDKAEQKPKAGARPSDEPEPITPDDAPGSDP